MCVALEGLMNKELMSKNLYSEINLEHFRGRFSKYTRKAFQMLPELDKPRILDIGCGSGVSTIELAKMNKWMFTICVCFQLNYIPIIIPEVCDFFWFQRNTSSYLSWLLYRIFFPCCSARWRRKPPCRSGKSRQSLLLSHGPQLVTTVWMVQHLSTTSAMQHSRLPIPVGTRPFR